MQTCVSIDILQAYQSEIEMQIDWERYLWVNTSLFFLSTSGYI